MIASLVVGMVVLLVGADPVPISLEPLDCKREVLATLPKTVLKVDQEGHAAVYSGVPLYAILERRAKPIAGMAGLRELSDAVLLIQGADNYQAAVSAAGVAMDSKGERYLLANLRDGQPIPVQLIVSGDPKRTRWVKDVVAIRLVRLNALGKAGP